MPIYPEQPITLTLTQGVDKGITQLVRYLGRYHWSSYNKFVADVQVSTDCILRIKFWGDDFSFESGDFYFTAGERKSISFANFVLTEKDYFYVEIDVIAWLGYIIMDLTLHNAFLIRGYDSLLLNAEGNLVNNESMFNVGYLVHVVDSDFIRSDDLEGIVSNFCENMMAVQSPVSKRISWAPANYLDSSNRYYSNDGNVLEIVKFNAWGSPLDIEAVTVSVNIGTGNISCTTRFGTLIETYTSDQFYEFNFGSSSDGIYVKVYGGISESAAVVAQYVKKYFGATVGTVYGMNTVLTFWQPVDKSVIDKDVSFVWNGSAWEATLDYDSTQDQNDCILFKDGISIPNNLWSFTGSKTIVISDSEYDSSASYVFSYKVKIELHASLDISSLSSIKELYLLPYIDAFVGSKVIDREVDQEELVIFESSGVGELKFMSNGDLSKTTVKKITKDREAFLPASAVLSVVDSEIRINPAFYSADAYFIVNYVALISDTSLVANAKLYWRYRQVAGWTVWREWDKEGEELLPSRYFDLGIARFINDYEFKLVLDDVVNGGLTFVRGLGLMILNPRSGELLS